MWLILILFVLGTLTGTFFIRRKKINPVFEKITGYSIYMLLFFMGLSVGNNPEIMQNIAGIGLKAVVIALFALLGSVLLSGIIFYFIFKR